MNDWRAAFCIRYIPVPSAANENTTNRAAESESEAVTICRLRLRLACVGGSMVYVFGISIFTDHQPQLLSDKRIYVLNLAHVLAVRVWELRVHALETRDSALTFRTIPSTVLSIWWNFIENKDLRLICIILGAIWFPANDLKYRYKNYFENVFFALITDQLLSIYPGWASL